ncbi:ABC transporter substrate-binding protein [Clostridium sp.]|uniref:ABC transporter substrate-binding protein n=1 Tax=Clostridium sp. TaxID=1506 RepID=UPI00345B5496
MFVSKKGVVIKDLKDLSGKKIAIPKFGNTQDLTLRKILSDNGLKDKTKGGTVEVRQAANADTTEYINKNRDKVKAMLFKHNMPLAYIFIFSLLIDNSYFIS